MDAMCSFYRTGDSYFTSYRDPNLARTYEVYKGASDYVKNFKAADRDMLKYIIGAVAKIDTPMTPAGEGAWSFSSYMAGITDEMIQKRTGMIYYQTNVEKIRSLAPYIREILKSDIICVLGDEQKIQDEASRFEKVRRFVIMGKKKSGFVAIIGRPNVGKSTLMNHLIGQKIAITSNKAQTTRNRIQTVYTGEEGQIVFLDTPGINKAKNKLGEYMLKAAEGTLSDVDLIMWLVEPTTFIGAGEKYIIEQLSKVKTPIILVVNKTDTVEESAVFEAINAYKEVLDFTAVVPVSALKDKNTDELLKTLFDNLEEGPMYFDEDTITDQPERAIVAEIIKREDFKMP